MAEVDRDDAQPPQNLTQGLQFLLTEALQLVLTGLLQSLLTISLQFPR